MSMNNIKNLNKLLKKLNKLGGNVQVTLETSIRNQCQLVKETAQDLAPIDTGDLRKSIRRQTKRYKNKIHGKIYTNSDHAAYVEFGTGKVGERTNKQEGISFKQEKWFAVIPDVGPRWIEGQPAQPYLYPALKDKEEKIIENISNDIKDEIRRIRRG